jgi:hypothetical protein
MTQAYAWQDIEVKFTPAGGAAVIVGEIKKVPAPQFTAEDIDVTNQDSGGVKEFISGLKEGNEIEFVGNDVPTDAGQIALDAAATAGTTGTFLFTFPSGRTVSFTGVVKTFDLVEDNKAAAFSCKVKVSGVITRGGATKQALTTLALTPSSGSATTVPAISPLVATTYDYSVSVVNGASSIDFTPTSTDATSLTVNGEVIAGSNTAATIALTAGAITKVGILCKGTGKTPTNYTFWVYRA